MREYWRKRADGERRSRAILHAPSADKRDGGLHTSADRGDGVRPACGTGGFLIAASDYAAGTESAARRTNS